MEEIALHVLNVVEGGDALTHISFHILVMGNTMSRLLLENRITSWLSRSTIPVLAQNLQV